VTFDNSTPVCVAAAMAAALALLSSGCGNTPPDALGEGQGSGASSGGGPTCATPNQGCPCSDPGEEVACGTVEQRSGNYVTCSEGTRTCETGAWGPCVGQYVTTLVLPSSSGGSSGITLQGLNPPQACVDDPCDPSCNTFNDDGSGLDAGPESSIAFNDGGVTLTGNPVPPSVCTALQITPNTSPGKDLVVTTMIPFPNTVAYTASLVPPSCYPGTPTFLWSINEYDIAQISSGGLLTLAVPIAGPITVSAYAGTLSASVVCNVTVDVVDTSQAPSGFSNTQFPVTTGPADSIQILYPYPATVFPLGLPPPLIQWQWQATAPASGPVNDPNFAQPALSPGNYLYDPTGAPWTYSSSSGVTTSNSGFTSGTAAFPAGSQVAFLQTTGSVTQSITIASGGSYAFSWYAIQRQNWGGPNDANFVVDGVVQTYFKPSSTNSWQTFSSTVSLTAGVHTIAFVGLNTAGGDDTIFLSDVTTGTSGATSPAASAVKVTLRFPSTGTPIFSWSEIEPELETAPTPSLPGQPRATIPQNVWNDFQQTVVRNSGATGGDAVFAIQRYVNGTLMGEVPTTIHFANGQLKGNVFYNSYGTNLVQNFGSTVLGAPFGAATLQVPVNGTTPTVVVGYNDPTLSGAGCRVCHNAAAFGSTLLSNSYLSDGSSGSGSEATTWTYNPTLATPALIQGSQQLIGTSYGTNKFTYSALSPDGTYLLTSAAPASAGGASGLYTSAGSAIASNFPSTLGAATPVFSDDAAHVAFNFYSGNANPLSTLSADGKSLAMMDFAAPGSFSNFRVLSTPSALYSVWPTFLPPGQNGVVFQNEITSNGRDWAGTRSTCDGTGSCNNIGGTGELWWVSTGATPVATRLSNLNGGAYMPRSPGGANYHGTSAQNPTYYEEVYNYEPAALPVTIGGYSWVAFTSRRLYGNVATLDPYWSDPRFQDLSVQPTTKKIWIAAIAPNPAPGTDPSFPAFYLPGQELLAGNSRAYFTLAACEAPGPPTAANLCTSNLDCCGGTASPPTGFCQLDPPPLGNPPTSHCVGASASMCSADGAACTSDTQCCNFATGSRCGSGTCDPAPPLVLYTPSTFVTNYHATNCPMGTYPTWRFFYWLTDTPTGTSIAFTAQTSIDGSTWGAPVAIGTAAPPPVVTPTWTSGPLTVDQDLRANGQASSPYLRVTATLSPNAAQTVAPTLTNWQVTYDCPSTE
jgi:hypothetical protein